MKWILAVVAVVCAGCSVPPLSDQNSIDVAASSATSSERTYRTVLGIMRTCYPTQYLIESNFFPEAKEGEIALFQAAEPRVHFFTMKIAQEAGGANVMMKRRDGFEKFDAALPQWVSGAEGGCPYGTKFDPRPPGSVLSPQNNPIR